ncbi:cytochrome P450 [Chitinophaga solisilvae]|uniref:cytochrome P450 n=1 Tax=Chitinophaga solisilvae TaxID=1233460 RepID=UPI0013710660|nr:cytochrome P450 [Chitinophaga solisilvae]
MVSHNSIPWFADMRANNPVFYDPEFVFYYGVKGAWQVFRHKEAKRVLSDYQYFSNLFIPDLGKNIMGRNVNQSDPPDHKKLRSLVAKVFVPAVISKHKDWIKQQCEEILEPWLEKGEMDFIHDFAIALPNRVIAQILGIPAQDHAQVHEWVTTIVTNVKTMEEMEASFAAQQSIAGYLEKMMELRRNDPQDDLVTHLLQSEVNGERLGKEDLLGTVVGMFLAGFETTASLLGNVMYTFCQHPEVLQHLLDHPEDYDKIINEVLRVLPSAKSMTRVAKEDLELGGQQIKKGDYINIWLISGNYDPEVFPDPETFDFNRPNLADTLSFGHGIHYCFGVPLTKLETQIALDVVFSRIRDVQIKKGATLEMTPSTIITGFQSLPVTFSKIKELSDVMQ